MKRSIKLSLASQALPQVIEAVAELADCFARQGRAKEALELILPVLQHPAQTKVTKQRVLKLRSMIEAQFAPGDLEKTAEPETLESVLGTSPPDLTLLVDMEGAIPCRLMKIRT